MHNDLKPRPPRRRPVLSIPVQASPVDRDGEAPAASSAELGVQAAARCRDLHGLAQQMCYATRYGVSV